MLEKALWDLVWGCTEPWPPVQTVRLPMGARWPQIPPLQCVGLGCGYWLLGMDRLPAQLTLATSPRCCLHDFSAGDVPGASLTPRWVGQNYVQGSCNPGEHLEETQGLGTAMCGHFW